MNERINEFSKENKSQDIETKEIIEKFEKIKNENEINLMKNRIVRLKNIKIKFWKIKS